MIEVVDPSTEAVIDTVADGGAEGVERAVRAARAARPAWAATPLDERLAALEAWAERTAAAADALGELNGVSTRDALSAPFGGMGDSGLGRELGRWGLEEFLEVKAVLGA